MNEENPKEIFEVTEIVENSYFFIQVSHNVEKFKKKIISDKIIPDPSHIDILNSEINFCNTKNKNNIALKSVDILKNFYENFMKMKEMPKHNTIYANNIKEILKGYNGEKKITLKIIQSLYQSKYHKHLSLMTISRILKNHLNMHFRKTVLKNPILNKSNYIIMSYCFIYGIIKALKNNLKLIFLDESGFQ